MTHSTGHPPLLWTVLVGYTVRRPVRPDERWAVVRAVAGDDVEARLVAHAMTRGGSPRGESCVMVTRADIVDAVC